MDKPNYSLLINKDQCPFCGTIGSQNPIGFCNLTMGPEIRENIKPECSHLMGPGKQGRDIVDTDAQQNGVMGIKQRFGNIVSRPLVRTDRGPGSWDKGY